MPKILAAELPLLESKFIPHAAHPCPFLSALSLSALLPIHQLPLSLAARPTLGAPASSSSERASRPPLADRASGRRSLPRLLLHARSPAAASSSSGAGSVPQREGTNGGGVGLGPGRYRSPTALGGSVVRLWNQVAGGGLTPTASPRQRGRVIATAPGF